MPGSGVMEEEVTKFLALEPIKAKRQYGEPHHADGQWYSAMELALTVMLVAMRLRTSEGVPPVEIWLMKILDFAVIYYTSFVPNFTDAHNRALLFTLEEFNYLSLHERGLSNPPAPMLEDAQESGQEEGVGQEGGLAGAHQLAFLDLKVCEGLLAKYAIQVNGAGIVLQEVSLFNSESKEKLTGEQTRAISGLTVPIPHGIAAIGENVFRNVMWLGRVIIPASVTEIGEGAFAYCGGLTAVVIPGSVTTIGASAFWGCSGLTAVVIPGSVTTIGETAFNGCSGLTSVVIPESVTAIDEYTFYGCSSLTSVAIPESVTEIGEYAFAYCSGLTELIIPEGVTTIGEGAFQRCSGLTRVVIPPSVTEIGCTAFVYCNGLTSIQIDNPVLAQAFQQNRQWYGIEGNVAINGLLESMSESLPTP